MATSQGARLQEERKRMQMTQTQLAEVAGVTKQSQINYEKGERHPDSLYLAAVAAVGVDVLYVLTGQRQSPAPAAALDEGDRVLLRNFHAAPQQVQKGVRSILDPSSDTPGEIKERPAQKAA